MLAAGTRQSPLPAVGRGGARARPQACPPGASLAGPGGEAPLRTLLIDNYDSYTYNLHQCLTVANSAAPLVIKNDSHSWAELQALLEAEEVDNVVISPGPGTPHNRGDLGVVAELLSAWEQPVLGVCLGFQALAAAHGARVVAGSPVHGRLSTVAHSGHPLFAGIPSGGGYSVVRYHSLHVVEASLPPQLQPIAWTVGPTHGPQQLSLRHSSLLRAGEATPERCLMGLAHRTRPHYGVQFHPESVASTHGAALLQNFARLTRRWQRGREAAGLEEGDRRPRGRRRPPPAAAEPPPLPPHSSAAPTLKVLWQKLDGALSSLGGSEALFKHLFGAHLQQNCFFLDSAATDRGRFSYMGGPGGPLWRRLSYRVPQGGAAQGSLEVTDGAGRTARRPARLLDHLAAELGRLRAAPAAALPFPFQGGFVGYLGYELRAECGAPGLHAAQHPDAQLFLADRLVALDLHTDDVYILAVVEADDAAQEAQALRDLELLQAQILAIPSAGAEPGSSGSIPPALGLAAGTTAFAPAMAQAAYSSAVGLCQRALHAGDSYELCLTTAWERAGRVADPYQLYQVLRGLNPAPYAAYLSFAGAVRPPAAHVAVLTYASVGGGGKGEACRGWTTRGGPGGGLQICCSSPERFLRGDATGLLEASPIKGTARRCGDAAQDAEAAARLAASEKDAAENLMIVDLLRNDLGRVCAAGSVHVPRLMEVQSFASVHQLVSTVRGVRRAGLGSVDCIRAAFPGGSMTGAPKLRSMQILDRLEGRARGVYSGSIGFLGFNDCFDLNIAIRTAVVGPGGVSVGAGGAVVVQSSPQAEYEEMCLKAERVLDAVAVYDALYQGRGCALDR